MGESARGASAWRHVCRGCDGATSGVSRRGILLGAAGALTAAAAGCAMPGSPAPAAAPDLGRSAGRIDVHHHLSPPAWLAEARRRGLIDALGANWTVQKSLADMDQAGIATAVLSVPMHGSFFEGLAVGEGRRIARESNEYAARVASDSAGRFGFFATLPLVDTEGSLREIAHAFDTLEADGIALCTSYVDKWLGDPVFFPVMEELDRRKAVVYTHPTVAACCANLQPQVPAVVVEFGTDTTRTVASILFSGNAARFRDIRWIFSHGGGTVPYLVERFVRQPRLDPRLAPLFPEGVAAELKRFWYDTAQVANPAAMSALAKVVPTSQIVFGSDFPYRTALDHVKGLRECGVFGAGDLVAIERETPARLLPGLRRRA